MLRNEQFVGGMVVFIGDSWTACIMPYISTFKEIPAFFSLMARAGLLMRDSQVSYKHPGQIWAEDSAGIDGRFAGYTLLLLLARQLAWE